MVVTERMQNNIREVLGWQAEEVYATLRESGNEVCVTSQPVHGQSRISLFVSGCLRKRELKANQPSMVMTVYPLLHPAIYISRCISAAPRVLAIKSLQDALYRQHGYGKQSHASRQTHCGPARSHRHESNHDSTPAGGGTPPTLSCPPAPSDHSRSAPASFSKRQRVAQETHPTSLLYALELRLLRHGAQHKRSTNGRTTSRGADRVVW